MGGIGWTVAEDKAGSTTCSGGGSDGADEVTAADASFRPMAARLLPPEHPGIC